MTSLAQYIWNIIRSGGYITMSWGIDMDTLKAIADGNGISFHVQGFKHKGIVEIVYNEASDYFDLAFVSDSDPTKRETVEDVTFDELVQVIDNHVEYTGESYADMVKKEYSI